MRTIADRLRELAENDDDRKAVLAGRKEREVSRTRYLVCPTCNERGFDDRGKTDCCRICLKTMWEAEDIIGRAVEKVEGKGLVGVTIADRVHFQPHPYLKPDRGSIPAECSFARPDSIRETADASRTMQQLFFEMLHALATCLPSNAAHRQNALPLFGNAIHMRLPREAYKAITDLWWFIRWLDNAAYEKGFQEGTDLLNRMVTGEATHDQFMLAIERQTDSIKRKREQIRKGRES